MALTKEQAANIKKKLFLQIDKLPQENKEQIKKTIEQLNEEQLEQFLKQNNIQFGEGQPAEQTPQCIFCSIAHNETPSFKIAENNKSIAILELNPISKGHSLIIPFNHTEVEKIPKSALTLAQKIAKRIKTKLKAEDVKIESSSFQGHAIINVIPFYKDIPPQKKEASQEELKKLQSKLETKKRKPRKPKQEVKNKEESRTIEKEKLSKLPQISFRIP